jgi:glutamyl-tRNA(Gln) amidotransferase subunit D
LKEKTLEGYSGAALSLLEEIGAEIGDLLEVSFDHDKVLGRLMPRSASDADDLITLKLANGYNLGLSVSKAKLKILQKSQQTPREAIKNAEITHPAKDAEYVSLLSTGGTIVSKVEYETGAVKPALDAHELVSLIPELSQISPLKTRVLMGILSEDMSPSYWEIIAKAAYDEVCQGAKGVVVAHGTDTMGYTAAALSFALKGVGVPIVLVGAQRSSDRPSSDARSNLVNAVRFAKMSDAAGVFICMHASTSDPTSMIIPGTHARKMHTSRRDAFKPVNARPAAFVENGEVKYVEKLRSRNAGDVHFKGFFSDKATLLYSYPGLKSEVIESLFDLGYQGLVFAGTGLGHVRSELVESVAKLKKKGFLFFMTSQCLFGRVNMNVYITGRRLKSAGVVPLEDMLPETAYAKLSWCLANYPLEKVEEKMLENVAGEMSDRSLYDSEVEKT